jgi:hypothetical protein
MPLNFYDSSHLANLTSRITDYEQNIVNGNLSIVNLRPHYESALKGDLTPFIQLKTDLEKILRQRIIEGKVGKIMVFADAACFMSQNRQFAECILLEKWWNDVHIAWIKNDQNIAVICTQPSFALMEESALYMKRQIGAQHSITIDMNKDLSLTGTKTKPIRILVAEPDLDIRNLYYAYLDSLGFDVVTVGISEKTTTRRLNRMKEQRLLDFSLQCSPSAMIGYIQFVIPIIVAKAHYHNVLERMYSEFQANILYSPSVIEPKDILAFILFGENVFVVDSVLARVNSFEGVKSSDAYILTKWQYYDDWIMKEINKRLLLRPVLHRSR